MLEAEPVDLTMISRSFPATSDPEIRREGILDYMDDMFASGLQAIVVESLEPLSGTGRTTTLAQFARRHADRAISLFLIPTSYWGYDLGIVRLDLSNQLEWLLYARELPQSARDSGWDEGSFRGRIFDLQKRARKSGQEFYFVVDGLDDIPSNESRTRAQILDLMPLGLPGFRFVFSSRTSDFSKLLPARLTWKAHALPWFSCEETVKYLSTEGVNDEVSRQLHKLFRGIPGYLASIKRIIRAGRRPEELLTSPKHLSQLFDLEWRQVSDEAETLSILSCLAYSRTPLTIPDLARMLRIRDEMIQSALGKLPFVTVEPKEGRVAFVSEAFRQYASERLVGLRNDTYDRLIADLVGEPDSEQAVLYLPAYMSRASRFRDLLDYLSCEHFSRLLHYSQSFQTLKEMAELGVSASEKLERDAELIRFSLQQSLISELQAAEEWRSEVQARMALGEEESALLLAQRTFLKEDRLHLLAVIAKSQIEKNLQPNPDVLEQIQNLFRSVDAKKLGEKAIEIACDLVSVNADLAIELLEQASSQNDAENDLDWAFTKLSFAALTSKNQASNSPDLLQRIQERIRDPRTKSFSAALTLLVGKSNSDEIIARVESIDEAFDRLVLLRLWLMENRENEQAATVLDYALKLVVSTTQYSPNARDLRELASPIPNLSDWSMARMLISKFDAQKGFIQRQGPTPEYVRLQLLLAACEFKHEFSAASNRLVELYLFISAVDDLSIRVECLAGVLSSLRTTDTDRRLEKAEGLHSLVERDLKDTADRLLAQTAEQYAELRGAIRSLARVDLNSATLLVRRLNTQDRRDAALSDLLDSATKSPFSVLPELLPLLADFFDAEARDASVLRILAFLNKRVTSAEFRIDEALPWIAEGKRITNPADRCLALVFSMNIASCQKTRFCTLLDELEERIFESWSAVDSAWEKANLGFRLVSLLANTCPDLAARVLTEAENQTSSTGLTSTAAATAYLACLRLAVRAFSGLMTKDLGSSDDEDHLAILIARVPSIEAQVKLWTEIALHYYKSNRTADCRRVTTSRIRPLLDGITDEYLRISAVLVCAPALYCAHPQTCIEIITGLPLYARDEAYSSICEFLLHKTLPEDPFSHSGNGGSEVTYEELTDVCSILTLMNQDSEMYHPIDDVVSSMIAFHHPRSLFSENQRLDIASRLERISKSKFPSPRYIQHDGYRIATGIQIARLRRAKGSLWSQLAESVRAIPNLSDRAFVFGILASALPQKERELRAKIADETIKLIDQIPTALDRSRRYEAFASEMIDTEPSVAKDCLKRGMQLCVSSKRSDLYSVQQEIVDLAHRLEPDLAASLTSLLDQDPDPSRAEFNLRRRIEMLDLKQSMLVDKDQRNDKLELYPQAAWMLLGSLNAGRTAHIHIEKTRSILTTSANLPISRAYPILSWAIQNAVCRYSGNDQAATILRPIFLSTVLATELAATLVAEASKRVTWVRAAARPSETSDHKLIGVGERALAMKVIKEWIENNVGDYLKICDQYFGVEDLAALNLVLSARPECRVTILTSKKHQNQTVSHPTDEAWRNAWKSISDQDPPETEVVIAGVGSSEKSPIHERYWLTRGAGLEIGTSFNAIGRTQESKIHFLSATASENLEAQLEVYLKRTAHHLKGEKISYMLFNL